MLKCSGYACQPLDILRLKSEPLTEEVLWMSVPSGAWMRPDTLQASDRPGCATSKLEIWLQALQEGLEVMDLRSDTVAVLVRTNIYKLAEAIRRDLYVKDMAAMVTSNAIHDLLARLPKFRGKTSCPLELRVVLIEGGTPHPRD